MILLVFSSFFVRISNFQVDISSGILNVEKIAKNALLASCINIQKTRLKKLLCNIIFLAREILVFLGMIQSIVIRNTETVTEKSFQNISS